MRRGREVPVRIVSAGDHIANKIGCGLVHFGDIDALYNGIVLVMPG